jgi:septum formation protein
MTAAPGVDPSPQAVPDLILASASPRRSAILSQLGIDHQVHASSIDEIPRAGERPGAQAERLAREKALQVAMERTGGRVLAGDTVVALGDEVLGKPRDAEEAAGILLRLAGREHRVLSALALRLPGAPARIRSGVQVTRVRFRTFDESTARAYVATGEPMDKAGAYGIQGLGAALVEEIEGDYSGVVGLPVPLLLSLLEWGGTPYRFPTPSVP